ncbi:MAG: cytochrome c biogenesis protein CcdA [Chloroflexi bacterium]|nr:cytochrome c biogenesis protein CcdA [Chloroflexota bacterium]
MTANDLTYGLAFLAGLASFLSPCVLSLVPAYLGYLGGRAAGGETAGGNRWVTFSHGAAFVLGFSVVFILFGISISALGSLLYDIRLWLARLGGLVVVIFGLHMIGVFRIPFLEYDIRVHQAPDRKLGYLSSFLMGIIFSAGWSPCVGPALTLITTIALTGGSIPYGILLLAAYSAGLALPFLAAALGVGWVTTILRRYGKVMRYVEVTMGIILIGVGILLMLGQMALLAPNSLGVDFGI